MGEGPQTPPWKSGWVDGFVPGKFATTIEGFDNFWNDFWRQGQQRNPPRHFGFIKPESLRSFPKGGSARTQGDGAGRSA